jgi:hypothetical protein
MWSRFAASLNISEILTQSKVSFQSNLYSGLLSLPLYCLTSLNDGFWPVCYLCHCIFWLLWMTVSDPFVIFAIVLSDFFEWRLLNPFLIFAIVFSDFFEWRLLNQLLSLPLYFLTSLNDGFWPVCYLCHCIVWLLWMTASDNPFVIFAIVLSDFFEWRLLNPFVFFAIVLSDFF